MSGDKPEEGDKVSWTWGPSGTQPSGVVSEKKTEGEVSVTSKRGNEITKEAKPNDPAVALERSGNPVVKNQSEVQVEEKNVKPELKDGAKSPSKGTKRKHEEANGDSKNDGEEEEEDKKEEDDDKKEDEEKDDDKKKKPAAEKKKPGRPAKAKEDKPKPAATKDDKPRANGEKKKPGRPPKDPNAPSAAKKQKKEPREGTRKSSRLRN